MKNNSKYVDESEVLYRFFLSNKKNPNEKHYDKDESDKILIDRAAYSGGVKPSVNRAKLEICPMFTKDHESHGVMGIWTKEIEALKLPDFPDRFAKVKKSPKPDRKSHAEIVLLSKKDETEQESMSRSLSRQFRKGLADISHCLIDPNPK